MQREGEGEGETAVLAAPSTSSPRSRPRTHQPNDRPGGVGDSELRVKSDNGLGARVSKAEMFLSAVKGSESNTHAPCQMDLNPNQLKSQSCHCQGRAPGGNNWCPQSNGPIMARNVDAVPEPFSKKQNIQIQLRPPSQCLSPSKSLNRSPFTPFSDLSAQETPVTIL